MAQENDLLKNRGKSEIHFIIIIHDCTQFESYIKFHKKKIESKRVIIPAPLYLLVVYPYPRSTVLWRAYTRCLLVP